MGNTISIGSGDTVTVTGYLDVLVDPGTAQPEIQAGPHLDMTRVLGQPVVSWAAALTNFVLETTTDLPAGSWVTNSSPITTSNGTNSLTVNPATGRKFFRLKE